MQFKFSYKNIPASVTLSPEPGKGTPIKRAIEKFREFNDGDLPQFTVEQVGA